MAKYGSRTRGIPGSVHHRMTALPKPGGVPMYRTRWGRRFHYKGYYARYDGALTAIESLRRHGYTGFVESLDDSRYKTFGYAVYARKDEVKGTRKNPTPNFAPGGPGADRYRHGVIGRKLTRSRDMFDFELETATRKKLRGGRR